MAKDLLAVDVAETPEVLRLVEEAHRSMAPGLLRRDREELAGLFSVGGMSEAMERPGDQRGGSLGVPGISRGVERERRGGPVSGGELCDP